MSTIPEILTRTREGMDKALGNTKRELGGLRSGKATPTLLDVIRVEAYGQRMALTQVASVSAPEPKLLTIQPWDRSLVKPIEKAILESDLGLTPSSDGTLIRVPVPPLTEERRRELVRVAHKLAEEGRVAIRHTRQDALNRLKKVEHLSDDDKKRAEKDIQKLTDQHVTLVDELVKAKEADLLEV